MNQGLINLVIFFVAGILIFGQITSVRSEEAGIESYGCQSCGKDCSAVCGSKQFRSCCYNYIKKRSENPALPNIGITNEAGFEGAGQIHGSLRGRETLSEDQLLPVIPFSSVVTGRGFPSSETLDPTNQHVLVLAEIPRRIASRPQLPSAYRKFFLQSLK